MRIGYLGPEGTYTQQATEKLLDKLSLPYAERLPLRSIDNVLESLNQGEIDCVVVPLRNSLVGDYAETAKGLGRYDFVRIDSVELQIKLALGIHPKGNKNDIKEIRSKDTALRECSKYLNEHYANAHLVEVESTAAAMQNVIQQNQIYTAAIGSEIGMKLYGLKIVDDDIGNEKNNFTTFVFLKRKSL